MAFGVPFFCKAVNKLSSVIWNIYNNKIKEEQTEAALRWERDNRKKKTFGDKCGSVKAS